MTRREEHSRIAEWIKTKDPDVYGEQTVADKRKHKNAGKQKKKQKDKDWWIEYKWKSRVEFNAAPKWAVRFQAYSEEWQKNMFGSKYYSLAGAISSFGTLDKRDYFYTTKGWSNLEGRDWRIRNVKTGEIHELKIN